jgi:hypothetical protein
MNAGVSIVPCGVVKRPRRAPVRSVPKTWNENTVSAAYHEKTQASIVKKGTKASHTMKQKEDAGKSYA